MKKLLNILAAALVCATAMGLVACQDDTKGTEEIPVTGVELKGGPLTMEIGDEAPLTANVLPAEATNPKVTYKSDDDTVATVDQNGLVTAVAEGSAVITVTTEEGGFEATCQVTVVGEEAVVESGTAGSLTWSMTDRGVLTVGGEGAMPDYDYVYDYDGGYSTAPWSDYLSSTTKLVVEEGVTRIGVYAFSHTVWMEEVVLPNSLERIRENAFSYSNFLREITIPAGVTVLEDYVFFDCYALSEVTLPEGLTTLGYMAFYDCMALSGIRLPSTLTSIGNSCFGGCSFLAEIEIPEGVTTIGSNMFNTCSSLKKVTLPSTVTSIGDAAFFHCEKMTELIVKAETPPSASSLPDFETTTLYVPAGSVEIYENDTTWGGFVTITAIPN